MMILSKFSSQGDPVLYLYGAHFRYGANHVLTDNVRTVTSAFNLIFLNTINLRYWFAVFYIPYVQHLNNIHAVVH